MYIDSLLLKHGINSRKLLEFGSGICKHVRQFTEGDYTAHGIERSAEMVATAQQTPGFTCWQDGIATIKMGHTYSAVPSLFHVMSYQSTNQQLQAVFSDTVAHLNPSDLFLLDFSHSPPVYPYKLCVHVKRMADNYVEITHIAKSVIHANDNRLDVRYKIFTHELATDAAYHARGLLHAALLTV